LLVASIVIVVGPVDCSPPPLVKTQPQRCRRVPQRHDELPSSETKNLCQRGGHASPIEGAQSPSFDGGKEASSTDAGSGEAGGAVDEGEI